MSEMSDGTRARRRMTPLALALALALTGCAAASGATEMPTSTASSLQPGPTFTKSSVAAILTESARGAVGAAASDVSVTYDPATQVAGVTITVTGDVPTTEARVSAAFTRVETLTFQEENDLWASGQPLRQVTVTVMGPVQDAYSGIINQVYSIATLIAATARNLPWPTLTPRSAWPLYDQTFLRPGFVEQDHALPYATATPGG
ncbi:MAG TPA: hypothetical protein VF808_01605 [Ktedonobacterales bacterium]